ncbi:hypothetical protein [Conexibacter woesei]|uniref:Imelysin-like domain-containing protein n=1 Tax=Conexibacter woesei (strain DSM 14684 / CCUG 47730 / CIP 108061 / JCM 11494 / NBRC 100937 / ID131577) TaxID=469383 RepID=D3F1U9_CONWI|nr:hypothetical protein [Conexibacter woesei]ADB54130.1 hypothetical protein Cwoe_5729 [Conexibacter woesei DSM 14684]
MTNLMTRWRKAPAVLAVGAALAFGACGGDDSSSGDTNASTTATNATAAIDYAAIQDYLYAHTEALVENTAAIERDAVAYHALAEAAGFDYARLLATRRPEVERLVRRLQQDFHVANPSYEEMEGVVAGVPELADFDVIIDAGGDASDPENAVPFSIETPAGRTFRQPGNFNFLVETAVYGTEPRFQAKGVRPDLDGDGRVEFGEAVPDADFVVATARQFASTARELDAAARKWEPAPEDVFTALVVMTPTMSEYFESWKNSRFVAGDRATEKAFVTSSRLGDITDILGGLVLVYDSVEPTIAGVDADQARQTGRSLKQLHRFATRLENEEADGRRFTAGDADTLGGEAQDQAEAVAGQISQAAGQLNITLEN